MIGLEAQSQIITNDEVVMLQRTFTVQYVDGKPVKRKTMELELRGNIQPLNARELLLVPEGDRFKEMYSIFTTNEIKDNDIIVRRCINFQVQAVEYWGSFAKARIVRIDVGPLGGNP